MAKRKSKLSEKVLTKDNVFQLVDQWVNDGSRYYFRGEPEEGRRLLPSLLRSPTYERLKANYKTKSPIELEARLIQRFRRYTSHIYHSHSDFHGRYFTDLEMLCLAQHNGLPTLLLDWTLNPFVGLYFALRSHYYQEPAGRDATLWVMRLAPKGERENLTVHLEDPPAAWAERVNATRTLCPLLVVPLVFTQRIAAQCGRFVYAAMLRDGNCGMDEIVLENKPWTALERYRIPGKERQTLLQRLTIIGTHEGTLFTDLEGWAKYLRDGNL